MVHRSLFVVFSMVIGNSIHAQDLTVQYNRDNSKKIQSNDVKGNSFIVLNNNLLTYQEFLFPDGRLKASESVKYDDVHVVEDINYIFTQGYEKDVLEYDLFGNETDVKSYTSQNAKQWTSVFQRQSRFNSQNHRVYFKSKGMSAGDFLNMDITYSYDYNRLKQTSTEKRYDRNDHELISHTGTSRVSQKYFNEETERGLLENQFNRITRTESRGLNGTRIFEISSQKNKSVLTFNANGQLIDDQFLMASGSNGSKPIYKAYYRFKFTYGDDGKLNTQNMIEEMSDIIQSKIVYSYNSSGKLIKESIYKRAENGTWNQMDTKLYAGNDPVFIPSISDLDFQDVSYVTPIHAVSNPVSSQQGSNASSSLINKIAVASSISATDEAKMFDSDLVKLQHLARVLNNQSDSNISEAEILRLALQLLIEEHRDEIKDLNDAYLSEQTSIFD